jgi:toxic protein SymE
MSYKKLTSFKNDISLSYTCMTMTQIRRLTVYTKFRTRRYDYTTIPEIRLEGKWLEKIGFNKGQRVKIEHEQCRLIITLDEEAAK